MNQIKQITGSGGWNKFAARASSDEYVLSSLTYLDTYNSPSSENMVTLKDSY